MKVRGTTTSSPAKSDDSEQFDTVQLKDPFSPPVAANNLDHSSEQVILVDEGVENPLYVPVEKVESLNEHDQHNHNAHHHHHNKKKKKGHNHHHHHHNHPHKHSHDHSHDDHQHHSHDHHSHDHSHDHSHRVGQLTRTNVQHHTDTELDTNTFKLAIMIFLVSCVFASEIFVGYVFHSLTLLSDAFHMLSDVAALIIALIAMWLSSKPKTDKLSYGYARAEVIGGLVNSIFLLSAVTFIYLEALEAMFLEPKEVSKPWTILGIGCVGLVVNLFGLILFGGHAHVHVGGEDHDHHHGHDHHHHHHHDHANMNMTAIFIHLLGDFLGSIAVISSSALLINFDRETYPWIIYVDPLISFLLATLILIGTIPLVKKCIIILLQSSPDSVDISRLKFDLMEINGILDIRELHVWQLSGPKIVCTVNVVCTEDDDYPALLSKVKATLHRYGIDRSTVEPCYVQLNKDAAKKPELLKDVDDDRTTSHHHHQHNSPALQLLTFDKV